MYATFGQSIGFSLSSLEPLDIENENGWLRHVKDDINYNLLLWVNGYDDDAMLYSEILVDGVNCVEGLSTITIGYEDTVTGAIAELHFRLEILTNPMYADYVNLGLTDLSALYEVAAENAVDLDDDDDEDSGKEEKDGGDDSDSGKEGGESKDGGDQSKGDSSGGGKSDGGGKGGGGKGGGKKGHGGKGGPGSSSDESESVVETIEVCEDEIYIELVDASGNEFVAFESMDEMVDKFLEDYDTVENYLRVFGGQVEFPEP